jgi:Zn-dependent M16 (insulinase) family peptidase
MYFRQRHIDMGDAARRVVMPRALLAFAVLLLACCSPPSALLPPVTPPSSPAPPVALDALPQGQRLQGFVAQALYVDDDGRARGARLLHERTRFVFDYLVIESAPQAFVYATTYPGSDDGAPHTQEHLLLGKGNKGRWLGNYDHVMLAEWSAFTAQYRTAYHFHTSAGVGAFWGILRTQLDALLHPDYSDEEIRREVRNFGVTKAPDGTLSLDEKGTVYNEMVGTYESANTLGWDKLGRLIYGSGHPLARSSGGTPQGIRGLTPEEIRRFHAAHYQLANMGMVGAFPSSVALPVVLTEVGQTLDALAPQIDTRRYMTEADVPPARVDVPGALVLVEYPYATADHPSPAMLAWPATRRLDVAERTLMEVFLAAFAGGESSTMYEALVDTKTRALDVGATSVWQYSSDDPGQPVFFGAESVSATHDDEPTLRAIRDLVLARLQTIATLPDGSPELVAFGERVKARILETRRRLDKALDTPPLFGTRGTGDFWIRQLTDLNRQGPFRKSLTQKDDYDHALSVAGSRTNPWRERIAAWGLLEPPCGVMTRASPLLRQKLDRERDQRIAAELVRLQELYGTKDPKEALRKRADDVALASAEIARAEASVLMPPFVSDPPMTMDDALSYRAATVQGVPVVASTFETMKSATVGIALRLDGVAEADLPYLSLLPDLLLRVGVIRDGVPIPYDEMSDRLRREVLDLASGFDASFSTGRTELEITGSGDDVEETRRVLGWMHNVLTGADWRPENLARIRDVVGRRATELREVMSGPEEHWASRTAGAYRKQESALLAHTASFLTRAHDAFRLSWLLEGSDKATSKFLASLAPAGKRLDRAALTQLAQALAKNDPPTASETTPPTLAAWLAPVRSAAPESRARIARAGRELGQMLPDLPDGSLATDWAYLCQAMARDSARDPRETLDAIRRVLGAIAHAANARVWMVGSSRTQQAVAGDLAHLLGALDPSPSPPVTHSARARVTDRARARGAAVFDARLAALVNPSTANGALVNSAPTAGYDERRDGALVDFLAANVFSGSGTHSFYKRIWGAALAYSGYMSVHARSARMELYSDRCADLPQLLRFVDGEVRSAPADPRFVEYAVANVFGARTGDTYELRAEAMATDLVEGMSPDRIRGFRARLLALRSKPGLAEAIHTRLLPVYAEVIPSLSTEGALPEGALWFAIGPEPQLARYENEVRAARGPKAAMLRLYPRDFWDVTAAH